MIKWLQKYYYKRLKICRIPEPYSSLKNLTQFALKQKYQKTNLFVDKKVQPIRLKMLENYLIRRLNNEPIQYILKIWHFRKLKVHVQKPVLIPRQETEVLVDLTLQKIKENKFFLEIGSGTGIISISLIKDHQNLQGEAVDIKKKCVHLTKKNMKFCLDQDQIQRLKVYQLDFDLIENKTYDFIVSNPPYIKTEEIKKLSRQVKNYEDIIALDGGHDGLDIIKKIIKKSQKIVRQFGFVILECGENHIQLLKDFVKSQSFIENIEIYKDQYEVERFLYYSIK